MLDTFANAGRDQVIPMIFEMARDKLDREWTNPHIDELTKEWTDLEDQEACALIARRFVEQLGFNIMHTDKGNAVRLSLIAMGSKYYAYYFINELYSKLTAFEFRLGDSIERKIQDALRLQGPQDIIDILNEIGRTEKDKNQSSWQLIVEITPHSVAQLQLGKPICNLVRELRFCKAANEERIGGQESMVELLFKETARRRRAGRRKSETETM